MTLRSAYFRDWKVGPTVLFWEDAKGMRQSRDWLRSAGAPDALAFETLCTPADGNEITIKAVPHERDAGMRFGRDGLEWSLQLALAEDFADKVDVLASSVSGHQYLDARGNDIAVEVSIGEYPETDPPTWLTGRP
jgi:hypothetical protein